MVLRYKNRLRYRNMIDFTRGHECADRVSDFLRSQPPCPISSGPFFLRGCLPQSRCFLGGAPSEEERSAAPASKGQKSKKNDTWPASKDKGQNELKEQNVCMKRRDIFPSPGPTGYNGVTSDNFKVVFDNVCCFSHSHCIHTTLSLSEHRSRRMIDFIRHCADRYEDSPNKDRDEWTGKPQS